MEPIEPMEPMEAMGAGISQRLGPPSKLRFLNYLMMGTPASPLYKALVDSGLGSRVIGGGLDDGMLQATFSVGLKDARVVMVLFGVAIAGWRNYWADCGWRLYLTTSWMIWK